MTSSQRVALLALADRLWKDPAKRSIAAELRKIIVKGNS